MGDVVGVVDSSPMFTVNDVHALVSYPTGGFGEWYLVGYPESSTLACSAGD